MKRVRVRYWGERSQSKVAALLGVAPSQVLRWENGDSEPRASDLIRFAEACNASPRDLVADLAEPVTQQLTLPFNIDPDARRVVRHLVELLRDRPPRPASGGKRRTA